jgi:hypothetical protein
MPSTTSTSNATDALGPARASVAGVDAMTTFEADLVTPEPHITETPAGGRTPDERTFRRLLLNTLVSGVTSSFLS